MPSPAHHVEHERLVPIPDEVSYLPRPLLSPIAVNIRRILRMWALRKPSFTRLLHAWCIRPAFARLPGRKRIAGAIAVAVCASLEWDKEVGETVTGWAVFVDQCLISQIPVIVDLPQQSQTLARKPDHAIVKIIHHPFMIIMSVQAMILVFPVSVLRVCSCTITQLLVLVKVCFPDKSSVSADSYIERIRRGWWLCEVQ